MNDWFEWNGKKCTEYGIHVSEHPPLTIPAERATFTNVAGKSGALTTLEGDAIYDDMVLTVNCFIQNTDRIPEIAAWLRGSGKVTFANRQGGWYEARVINQISFEQVLRGRPHRTFAVTFRCKPFFYLNPVEPITLMSSGSFLDNPGCVASEPVITIYGLGPVTLMVGMTITVISYAPESIVLDTPLQEAYHNQDSGQMSVNTLVSGDYPMFNPGRNAVSWMGNVSSVVIQPNWRTL